MMMLDTALKAAEYIGLRDRTPREKMRATYNDLATQAQSLWDYLPSRSNVTNTVMDAMPSRTTMDWTSLTVGVIVGTAVGFGLGLYFKDSMTPAMRSARKQMKKAQEAVSEQMEQLPQRLNITRMEEEPAKK